MTTHTGEVDRDTLREIVRRIVEVAEPERIVMFGSAARGEMGPHSDIDLLVIKAGAHRRHLAEDIHERMVGVGQAVDVVVATPDDIDRYGNSPALIYRPALRDGTVVYLTE